MTKLIKPIFGSRLRRTLFLSLSLLFSAMGCGQPNPVDDSPDPTYIPFADTAFLIPRKIWLKGYSRNSTDGKVSYIKLHALGPEVKPWSPAVNDRMYGIPGWGEHLEISMNNYHVNSLEITEQRFLEWGYKLKPSNVFNDPAIRFYEGQDFRSYGDRYAYFMKGRIKYWMLCYKPEPNDLPGRFYHCDTHFRYKQKYPVTITFGSHFLRHWVAIAQKTERLLEQLEGAGAAYKPLHKGA